MINITDKKECNGCCACVDVCPTKAISLVTDIEGFWYPEIDMELCIDCGLCEKVCPELHITELKKNEFEEPICYGAIHKDLEVRWDSTSGGLFSVFAEKMYEQNGYVSGAIFNDDFSVKNFISNNEEDLPQLRSSKYLQSKAEGLHSKIKKLLINNEKVLACGTPCQMAGLRRFLGKDYSNLIIIDFICRGVNSPKVFRKYLDSLEDEYGSKVVYIKEKNKELGWRSLSRKVVFENNKVYYGVGMEDSFRYGFHQTNVYCRPACYSCKYKGFPRIADITIADFWGIEKVNKNFDNNLGTSLIMVNNNKGAEYFNSIKSKIEWGKFSLNDALPHNQALVKPLTSPTIDREGFFKHLDKNTFDKTASLYFSNKKKLKIGVKQRLKALLRPWYNLVSTLGFNPITYYRFLWLNFFRKNTKSNWKLNHLIFPTSHTVFDIHPDAKIIINKAAKFGAKSVKGSKYESRLKMDKNISLVINDGPLTRYGTGPYLLRYGFDIQIVNEGKLIIGQGASNMNLNIMCAKEITIGNGVRIGRNVTIRDWNGPHVILSSSYRNHAPVIIGDNVWIASDVTIMPGVTIGDGAVIGGNSLVNKDVPKGAMVAGTPARIINENIEWY